VPQGNRGAKLLDNELGANHLVRLREAQPKSPSNVIGLDNNSGVKTMLAKSLATIVLGMSLMSGAAPAQTNPPSTSNWLTQEKAGQWRATKLKGLNVYNNNNEKIGDINELIVDKTGKIESAVIGVGGFLGVGEHDVAVPFSQLKWVDEPAGTTGTRTDTNRRSYPDHAVLNMTKDQLKAAPEFKYAR
jgi:sporulation protein YlmC with PRC-barrel domain